MIKDVICLLTECANRVSNNKSTLSSPRYKRRHPWTKIWVKTWTNNYNFVKFKYMREFVCEECLEDEGEVKGPSFDGHECASNTYL